MTDHRTEDQKVAAVDASMTMAGQPLNQDTEAEVRRIFRGETSVDNSVLAMLEHDGYGDSARAGELRERVAGA
ncbi:hypothetical protein ACT3SZ_14115 [Corynebacterium sp. AOP40-9SA-29]|uniref:hypothetical protein n=1 Tax=Corynebacterium sp. AOP40-9SA-29 TaxID=3457677 RepID=UPI00403399D0